MSAFETSWNGVQPILDGYFGEPFTIAPKVKPATDPNGRAINDPARPPMAFVGIWTDPHAVERPLNRSGHPQSEGGRFGDDKPTVDFTVSALPYQVQIGDVVTRQETGIAYAISDVGLDGFTRTTVALTASRAPRL